MGRHEDDGDVEPGVSQLLLKIHPAESRHSDVEHQTGGAFRARLLEEIATGGEGLDLKSGRADQALRRAGDQA